MTRSLSIRPGADAPPSEASERFVRDGYQWCVLTEHAEVVRSSAVDWFDLGRFPSATLIKRNSGRDVWKVRCADREYFAKLYHPNGWFGKLKSLIRGSTAACEWAVGLYAAAHGIAAVKPIATATRGIGGIGGPSLLITEAVPDVESLSEYWLLVRDDRHRANLLAESLARLIARAHQCGFRHCDMHPGNILVRRSGRAGEALFVDLHNVRINRSVPVNDVIANLAQLHQWFRRHSTLTRRQSFLERYIDYRDRFAQASPHARNFRISPREMIEQVAVRAEQHSNRLWAKRDRRTRRNGAYFTQIAPAPGWRGHVLLKSKHPSATAQAALREYKAAQWESWLASPLDWVNPSRHPLMKDSHTATICKAELPTDPPVTVIVKRPLARNLIKRIGQIFGPSRNMRAWHTANRLLNRDLPVAQPIAIVERFVLGFIRTDSVSFTDYIAHSVDVETFLTRDLSRLDTRERRRVKNRLIDSLVRLIRMFHQRGFVHRDLKAGNLLVNWSPPYQEPPKLTFIDMDGIRYVGTARESLRRRAIVRLCVSLMNSPLCTRSDLLRFLKRDLRRFGSSDASWKRAWHECEALVLDKQKHKAERREWKIKHYGRE